MNRHSPRQIDAVLDALAALASSPAAHFVLGVVGLSIAAFVLSGSRP